MGLRPRLKILMPLIRPENLERIAVAMEAAKPYFRYRLVVILDHDWARRHKTVFSSLNAYIRDAAASRPELHFLDADVPGEWGERNLNAGMRGVCENNWVWFHADDNLPTDGFFEALRKEIDTGAEIVVFPMDHAAGRLSAKPQSMVPGNVDMAQLAVKGSLIEDMKWGDGPTADGDFIKALYEKYPDKFRFVQEPVLRYNALR